MGSLSRLVAASSLLIASVAAQTGKNAFPEGIFQAKTIAVINDTHTPQVDKGAEDALKSWGQF